MSPSRLPTRDLLAFFVAALVLRGLAAWLVPPTPYTDAAYYTLVAQQLATGHGFNVPVLWSFLEVGGQLPAHPMLPVPSNGHWMPLTSIVAAGGMLLFGPTAHAGQVPMVILSAVLVSLTYLIAWEWWQSRRTAILAGALALFAGPLLVHYPLVDNFALFGVVGALALWTATRAVRSDNGGRWIVISGALVGLATLARVDGLLLAVAPAVAWWLRRERLTIGLASAAACLLVLTPWLLRDLAVFGSPLPSAGGHTLWIRTYNEQFSIGHEVSLQTYLSAGPMEMVASRLGSWVAILGRTLGLLGGLFALVFFGGAWVHRRRPELAPFLAYWAVMFVVMGLVFTFHAPMGAFLHSAGAWLPFAFALAAGSVGVVATAGGRFWPFLRRPATHRFLEVTGVLGAVLLSIVASASQLVTWQHDEQRLEAAAAFLQTNAGRNDVVLSADPSRLYLLTGNPGIAAPFDPFAVVAKVVRAYDARWVVVTLAERETRDPLGLWNGAGGVDSDGAHPAFLPAKPAFEAPGVRVYKVVR
jgi:4-amino-4-deoxy-L-arabinose transferase-like glycosyltransferase